MFAFTTGFVIYLKLWKPLDSSFANNMAVLDEVTITFILYNLMLFTDF